MHIHIQYSYVYIIYRHLQLYNNIVMRTSFFPWASWIGHEKDLHAEAARMRFKAIWIP